ncbi:Staphylococcal virulence regulator protein A [Blautia hydrogenotrophica]|uniref:MATE family efflux transporter n=1 Tax=Blautia hydrogenotrophica TaxID=53443 RepID=UPI0006C7137E|nr:MATE family efflux transporter [Blautia hydrogenotrophica]CUM90345.1 Staphylococcal virulence regulator protein A [Blautia hydrogenotrophica]SCH54637.1 Staphylococcal virulence regulator protein A [uncultured Blautia sp.]
MGKKQNVDRSQYLFDNHALFALILPLVIEQMLAVLVGMADSIMIANVGESAVSGVSLVDSVMLLLINAFSALATGGAVVTGQYLGQKNTQKAQEAAQQLIWFLAFLAIGVMALMYLAKGFILHTVFGQITAEVRSYAEVYLLIVAASIPFVALYNAGAAIFRVMGNSKVSMQVSIVMNIINVVGNAILIYGFHRGSEGVAIPTLVSRMVAAIMILWLLGNKDLTVSVPRTIHYHFDKNLIKKILYIGIPNGLENSMFQLGKIMVLSLVATFGTYAIAANAVSNVVASVQILPGMAMSLAITTVISRCIGANAYDQAQYYTKKLHMISYLCMWVLIGITVLALPLILKVYNLSDITASETRRILLFHGVSASLIWPVAFNLPSVFRAAGDVKFSMVTSIISMWICRIVFSYILGKYMGFGVFGVWMAMILDWIVRAICFIIRYRSGKWKGKSLV